VVLLEVLQRRQKNLQASFERVEGGRAACCVHAGYKLTRNYSHVDVAGSGDMGGGHATAAGKPSLRRSGGGDQQGKVF